MLKDQAKLDIKVNKSVYIVSRILILLTLCNINMKSVIKFVKSVKSLDFN